MRPARAETGCDRRPREGTGFGQGHAGRGEDGAATCRAASRMNAGEIGPEWALEQVGLELTGDVRYS